MASRLHFNSLVLNIESLQNCIQIRSFEDSTKCPYTLKLSTGLWQNVSILPRTHSSDEGLEYLHLLVSPSRKSDLPHPPSGRICSE
jgi:hypothetical protein